MKIMTKNSNIWPFMKTHGSRMKYMKNIFKIYLFVRLVIFCSLSYSVIEVHIMRELSRSSWFRMTRAVVRSFVPIKVNRILPRIHGRRSAYDSCLRVESAFLAIINLLCDANAWTIIQLRVCRESFLRIFPSLRLGSFLF